ncbi:MAG: hypothetical protein Q8R02_01410 [Hyphomonadaceae bacterium]|nr:hypothetical protein [Hyphomonadaceae bacterium]
MSIQLLPAWGYAAIAAIPVSILAVFGSRFDTLTRIELAIPAVVFTGMFVAVAVYRLVWRG